MKRSFFDSNILLYSVDKKNAEKSSIAQRLLVDQLQNKRGTISTQVLQEFYQNATRKLKISPEAAKHSVQQFQKFPVVQVTPRLIESGIDISINHQLSFWDGLIIAAAQFARCDSLYTEDLNDGQVIGGVKIINPFD